MYPSPPPPVLRWATVLLLLWLPAVKWVQPPGLLRVALFYGGGCLLAALAVRREGDWPRVRPLLAAPLWGVAAGVAGYGALLAGAALVLYVPLVQPMLPWPLYDLAALFDPLRIYLAVARGEVGAAWPLLLGVMAGAVIEEALFRMALFWRWAAQGTDAQGRLPPGPTVARLVAVSAYFSALHWPLPPDTLLVALLGGLVAGAALWRWRSFTLVATLHALFNAHQVL